MLFHFIKLIQLMERVKIILPPSPSFFAHITIRITDLNYGGHVGNDSFLSFIHEARQQFLLHHGYSELDFCGTSLIMADAAIEYKHELTYAQELKISVSAGGFDKIGFDIYYLIELNVNENWVTAGKVKTGMMCFDYKAKKRVAVPQEAIEKLLG